MLKSDFFTNTSLSRYTTFTLLFQTGMAVSLASMPIYFKNENAISAYGVAYSVMAITGAFSFVYGVFVDRVGFARALAVGALLYAVALSLRVFTQTPIAIMTAIMAGVGASTALLANRGWVLALSESSTQNTTQLSAMRSMLVNIGMLIGSGLVSLMVYLFGAIYFWLLLLAGGLVFGAMMVAYQNHRIPKTTTKPQKPKASQSIKAALSLSAILFIIANFIVGVYAGLFKPYLILMFVEYGVSESKSVFIYLLTTAMSIVAGMGLLKFNQYAKTIPFMGFVMSMIGFVLAFVLMSAGLYYQLGLWVLIIGVLARTLFMSLATSFEEVLEYELLDRATLGVTLGFTQTAFLAGDALGSLITSLWVVPKNINDYAQICLYCAILAVVHIGVIGVLKKVASSNTV